MTNVDSILKSRDITLPTKVRLVNAKVFPVVMSGCESWTIKKVESLRIDAFELWCWRRLLTVPWPARRSNQSILKKTSPEYSLGGLMLKLKLQYFWPPDAKSWLIWRKDPDAGKDWGQEEKGTTEAEVAGWHHRLDRHEFEQASGVGDGQGSLACCSPWGRKELDTTEQLNWTEHSIIPGGSDGKESCLRCRKTGFDPWLGRPPERVNSYPLQYSGLENSMDCIVHGVAKGWTRLSDFHTHTSSL